MQIQFPRSPSNWSAALALAATLVCAQRTALAAEEHWVTTWGCAPQLGDAIDLNLFTP
jgi:hypothetical protein